MGVYGLSWAGAEGEKVVTGASIESFLWFLGS